MNESLQPFQPGLLESREESLTRQFYQWETRGRGWLLCNYPVELEPPFRPVYFFEDAPENPVDDSHVPTFFSKLFGASPSQQGAQKETGNSLEEFRQRIAELDEPVLCDYHEEEFQEVQLILPNNFRIALPVAEQVLLSLSHCRYPISFEVIGTREQTVVQFASAEIDFLQLKQQLSAYFPGCVLTESYELLSNEWLSRDGCELVVDFGLSNEFMLPIDPVRNFEIDPLIAIAGALSNLDHDEIGVFQVLFRKTRSRWAEEIMDSVRFFDGTPFFSNAPEMIPLAKQKIDRPLFAAAVRVASKSYYEQRSLQIIRNIAAGFSQLANPGANEIIPLSNDGFDRSYHEQALLRRLTFRCGMILNSQELVSLVHPPSPVVRSEKLVRDSELTKSTAALATGHELVLGENSHRNKHTLVTLSNDQRTRHMHLIGSSGSGKSTLLLSLIKQDLDHNQGICVIDPHGDLIDAVVENIPENRINDVVLFDPSDADYPVGFNILQARSQLEKTILSSDLVATFRRMSTSWGDVMDSVLANAILAFVESTRGGTLFELKRFLVEKDFRAQYLKSVTDEAIVYFWENEFPLIAGKPQASILIRLDAFLRQSLIRNIVCQKENKLDFRRIMDGQKILLVKLSQGLIGEENAYLLGTMLVSRLYQSALSRQDSQERPFFWLYLDEFHHFITPSMERILSGTRKYNLGLILAHQEFRQMQARSQEVASSVLSNCYTRICFRLGDNDAEKFAGGFSFFDAKALQNLGVGEAIARVERADYDFNLSVNQVPAVTKEIARARIGVITDLSRRKFGKPKSEVELELQLKKLSTHVPSAHVEAVPPDSAISIANIGDKDKVVKSSPAKPNAVSPVREEAPSIPDTAQFQPQGYDQRTQQHRYLQSLVKRIGENKGFRVTIEKEVFGGVGKIDVTLEDEARKIACEISVTNEPDYEVQNVQKCISAGYSPVIMISADPRHLGKIRQKVQDNLSADHLLIIKFFTPEEFYSWLEDLESIKIEDDKKVKGFKVKVNLKPVDQAEQSTRKRAISDVVFGALKRLKNKGGDK